MSTSILYHGFSIVGYNYVKTQYQGNAIIFTISHKREKLYCPVCKSQKVVLRGTTKRRFKAMRLGFKVVFLELEVQRVGCLDCDSIRQVPLGFADPRFSYTHGFERYALELSKHMTIQDVAQHLSVSWDVIKDIQKRYLTKRFSKPCVKHLKTIAIDEIAVRKGHVYLTVVMDMQSGAIVFVGNGKKADALDPFWERLKRAKAKIEAVAMDMSPAYLGAVTENLPKAVVVFDHFHVIKLFNDQLSELRRDLYHEAKDVLQKKILKGTRWLLLKNPDNLDSVKKEKDRLEEALQLNKPLSCAYYLKEDLRQIWLQNSKAKAERVLTDWIKRAESSGIKMLMKFAKTIAAHRSGILAYYDYRISSGPLEGTNNKIKTMKRMAYGFRDMEFFKLKIMAIHEAKYALVV
jgi:transposase